MPALHTQITDMIFAAKSTRWNTVRSHKFRPSPAAPKCTRAHESAPRLQRPRRATTCDRRREREENRSDVDVGVASARLFARGLSAHASVARRHLRELMKEESLHSATTNALPPAAWASKKSGVYLASPRTVAASAPDRQSHRPRAYINTKIETGMAGVVGTGIERGAVLGNYAA